MAGASSLHRESRRLAASAAEGDGRRCDKPGESFDAANRSHYTVKKDEKNQFSFVYISVNT